MSNIAALDDVLTPEEAAVKLKRPVKHLLTAARRGEIPAKKIGRSWVFKMSELEKWFADWRPNTFDPNQKAKEILESISGKKRGGMHGIGG